MIRIARTYDQTISQPDCDTRGRIFRDSKLTRECRGEGRCICSGLDEFDLAPFGPETEVNRAADEHGACIDDQDVSSFTLLPVLQLEIKAYAGQNDIHACVFTTVRFFENALKVSRLP